MVCCEGINDPPPLRPDEVAAVSADAGYSPGIAVLLQREGKGAPNKTDADNCYVIKFYC